MDVTRGAEQIITAMITINRSAVALDDGSDPNLIDLTEFRNTYPAEAVRAHDRALGERKNGNLSKAIELLKEAIELAPDFYLAHNTLGLIYQQAGQPNEARHEFLAARALNPRAADPLINLGRLYPQAGEKLKNRSGTGIRRSKRRPGSRQRNPARTGRTTPSTL